MTTETTEQRFQLRVALYQSAVDARRGVARIHPLVLDMLEMRPWDPVKLVGTRTTGALAAAASFEVDRSIVLLDDITCINAGVGAGDPVGVTRADVAPARAVTVAGGGAGLADPEALRIALLGKILTAGDRVSLLPQDFSRPWTTESQEQLLAVLGTLNRSFGTDWQREILDVLSSEPSGLVRVTMETVVSWAGGASTSRSATPLGSSRETPPVPEDLPGLETQISSLREWLDLGFNRADLLAKLGAPAQMGVLVTGPAGSGKAALVEAVAGILRARLVRVWGPALARADPTGAANELRRLFASEQGGPTVVLLEDVDAIAPREEPGPLLSVLLEEIGAAVKGARVAVVCTTARPEATAVELRRPGILDHEIEISLPQREERRRIIEVLARRIPLAGDVKLDEVAARTPGFVAADLMALCREASLHAAQRVASGSDLAPEVSMGDFNAALDVVRPSSMEGTSLEIADTHLDDVGDMDDTKKELTEAILWPLQYPDTFQKMGVTPPRGVLLFGPPGCGKTFIMKALANDSGANFFSVKGAELLSKWVGESERAVREVFRRARGAAPSLVFFDEIDSLAPPRGRASGDSGVSDRVVAQLLTELDGVEEMSGVFVVGATNRPDLVDPALLRPGRLERLIFLPPPDAVARGMILRAATKRMPLASDLDLPAIGANCENYSAADLDALAREAAMTAMRENMQDLRVTAAHFARARDVVKPSLRADQVVEVELFAKERGR